MVAFTETCSRFLQTITSLEEGVALGPVILGSRKRFGKNSTDSAVEGSVAELVNPYINALYAEMQIRREIHILSGKLNVHFGLYGTECRTCQERNNVRSKAAQDFAVNLRLL